MYQQPCHPTDKAGEFHFSKFHYCGIAGHGGHGAFVEVFKRLTGVGVAAVDFCDDVFCSVFATLDGYLRHAGEIVVVHHVADDKDVVVVTNTEIGVNHNASGAVNFYAGLVSNEFTQRGSGDAGGPDFTETGDSFYRVVLGGLVGDRVFGDVSDNGIQLDGDTEFFQLTLCVTPETFTERWKYLGRAVEKHDFR